MNNNFDIGIELLKESYVADSHNCSSTDNTGVRRKFKVNELINYAIAQKLKPELVKITDIRSWQRNTQPWCKKGEKFGIVDMAKHFKRVTLADTKYPLILSPEKSLMDGYHRLCKLYAEGKTEVMCIVLPSWPEDIAKIVKGTEGLDIENTGGSDSVFIED